MLFFFNDTPPTEIYTLSLHDALPISSGVGCALVPRLTMDPEDVRPRHAHALLRRGRRRLSARLPAHLLVLRSEEHTSELQSHSDLVCRLLLEKKKKKKKIKKYMKMRR